MIRVAHAVAQRVTVLQLVAGVIVDEPSHAGDLLGIERRDCIHQPVFVGNRVVIDEGHEFAARHFDSHISRDRKISLRAAPGANFRRVRS